ncbi:MAG: response regulator [Magnetospirillum sp.]|nr:response regulator [Magnetospirillum sp.]
MVRDRTKGLGLGLAIVRRLCRLLDHTIEVASRPGRGTRFSLFLPAVAPSSPDGPLHVADTPRAVERTILVIDDEASIRSGLALILESWGYRVIAAESGAEAVAAVAGGIEPDAIIADYRLRRGETGVDAIRLVVDRVGRSVPSLVLTGDTGTDVIAAVRDAGFPLMHKPLTTGALLSALATLLGTDH